MSQTKLPAYSTGYATINHTYFSGGAVTWERYGDLVVVSIADLTVSKTLQHGVVIATGLPKPRVGMVVYLIQFEDSTGAHTMRVALGTDGKLNVHYSGNSPSDHQYSGQIIYVAAE